MKNQKRAAGLVGFVVTWALPALKVINLIIGLGGIPSDLAAWRHFLSLIIARFGLLDLILLVLGLVCLWVALGMPRRKRSRFPEAHTNIVQSLAAPLAECERLALNLRAWDQVKFSEAWAEAERLAGQIPYDPSTVQTVKDFIQACLIVQDDMQNHRDDREARADVSRIGKGMFRYLHDGKSVDRTKIDLPNWCLSGDERNVAPIPAPRPVQQAQPELVSSAPEPSPAMPSESEWDRLRKSEYALEQELAELRPLVEQGQTGMGEYQNAIQDLWSGETPRAAWEARSFVRNASNRVSMYLHMLSERLSGPVVHPLDDEPVSKPWYDDRTQMMRGKMFDVNLNKKFLNAHERRAEDMGAALNHYVGVLSAKENELTKTREQIAAEARRSHREGKAG